MNAGNTWVESEIVRGSTRKLSESARRRILSIRGEPLFYADWQRAVFIHFEVDQECLQAAVPFALDLDEGRAYVSLVAFTLRGLRPRVGGKFSALLFKPIANHEFLNVRAYVRHGEETGIHFLAEWLSNPLSVQLGPRTFGLPYRFGQLEYNHQHELGVLQGTVSGGKRGAIESPSIKYRATVDPSAKFSPCDAGSRAEFLLERYTAFTQFKSFRRFFRIWHPPWPQVPLDLELLDTSLLLESWPWFKDARLISANYSPGLTDVWMGRPLAASAGE